MLKPIEQNRFSVFVKSKKSPDYASLEEWRKWFLARGIPAQIKCVKSGYALFREGLVDVPRDPADTSDESEVLPESGEQ
jgi:hypothetical protein